MLDCGVWTHGENCERQPQVKFVKIIYVNGRKVSRVTLIKILKFVNMNKIVNTVKLVCVYMLLVGVWVGFITPEWMDEKCENLLKLIKECAASCKVQSRPCISNFYLINLVYRWLYLIYYSLSVSIYEHVHPANLFLKAL